MKRILLIGIFCLPLFGFSQEEAVKKVVGKFIEFGWKGGLNLNSSGEVLNITNEFTNVDDAKAAVSGFNIGIYSQVKLLMLYVRPELHFSKYDTDYENITVGQSRIELPVSVGLKVLPFLSGFVGPTYRYKLDGGDSDYTLESVKGDSTLGVHFGVRLHLGKLGIDARLERGISNEESTLLSNNNINIGTIDTRPNLLSVGLSYSF